MAAGEFQTQCACGACTVRVDVPDDLAASDVVACLCHCLSCKRAHGAPLYQVAYLPARLVHVAAGAPVEAFGKDGGREMTRAFCRDCGTRVYNLCPGLDERTGEPHVGIFPHTIADGDALPPVLRAGYNNCPEECTLHPAALPALPGEAPPAPPACGPLELAGECYCGAVKVTLTVPEGGIGSALTGYCCCRSCTRAHAAPLYQVAYVPRRLVRVEGAVKRFDRGTGIVRGFCGVCGSRTLVEKPAMDELVGEASVGFLPALLDNAAQAALPRELAPAKLYNEKEAAVPWDVVREAAVAVAVAVAAAAER